MGSLIPKYRLCTVKAVPRSSALNFLRPLLVAQEPRKSDVLECTDGSIVVLHESANGELVHVEFQCQFSAESEQTVSFGLLNEFLRFCKEQGTNIKVRRNNSIIPPSGAAVFSDLKWSLPYKTASHLAQNPKDTPFKVRKQAKLK